MSVMDQSARMKGDLLPVIPDDHPDGAELAAVRLPVFLYDCSLRQQHLGPGPNHLA